MVCRIAFTHCKLVALSVSLLFLFSIQCTAQIESRWIGVDGNWSDASNWDNGVPNGLTTAVIDGQAGATIQDIPNLAIAGLRFDSETASIVLNSDLAIGDSLTWSSGAIRGAGSVLFNGVGQINAGILESTFENLGFIEFSASDQFVRLDSQNGGQWINRSGSRVEAPNGVLIGSFNASNVGSITVEPGSVFRVGDSTFQTVWDFENAGSVELDTFGFFFANYSQLPEAQLLLNDAGADFFQATELAGLISGSGSILNLNGPFEVEFEPGGSQIGQVTSGGSLIMTPDTISNFQIGPEFTSDLLHNLGGPLQLNGTLNIEALPGASPGVYTLFSYNNNSMLSVDSIQLGEVPAGFQGFLQHVPQLQRVDLIVQDIDAIILGDINQDGVVNLLDVDPFIQRLANGIFQVEADINGDGNVNLLDVAGFIELLNAA